MDNQFNQNQQQGDPYQQQGNPYQQQGNPYQQQGNPYQQQGNQFQQEYGYQKVNPYQQETPPNIFQQFALAFVPTKYSRLTKVKTGSMIGFVTLLVLIATVFSFISLALVFSSVDMNKVADALPDFEVKNGRLYLDEDFMYDDAGLFVYMTEDVDGFSYDDAAEMAAEGYSNILLIGRDRLSLMQNAEYQQLNFKDLGNSMEISRTWIVTKLVPLILVILAIVYVFIFVGRVLWYFACAALYLLLGMLMASIMKKQVEAGALFRVAVYSKVVLFVIATVIELLPFVSFSIPFGIRLVATLAFMGIAIAKLEDDYPSMPMTQGWQ